MLFCFYSPLGMQIIPGEGAIVFFSVGFMPWRYNLCHEVVKPNGPRGGTHGGPGCSQILSFGSLIGVTPVRKPGGISANLLLLASDFLSS